MLASRFPFGGYYLEVQHEMLKSAMPQGWIKLLRFMRRAAL